MRTVPNSVSGFRIGNRVLDLIEELGNPVGLIGLERVPQVRRQTKNMTIIGASPTPPNGSLFLSGFEWLRRPFGRNRSVLEPGDADRKAGGVEPRKHHVRYAEHLRIAHDQLPALHDGHEAHDLLVRIFQRPALKDAL